MQAAAEIERRRLEEIEKEKFFNWLDLPGDPQYYWDQKEEWGYENYKNRNSETVSAPPVSEAQEDYLDDDDW